MEEIIAKHINYALEIAKKELPKTITNNIHKKEIELTDYQYFFASVFIFLEQLNSILLFWETGYGKTLACIYVIKNIRRIYPNWKVFLFIKASLRINPWSKNIEYYIPDKEKSDIYIIHYDSPDAEYMFNNILRGIDKKNSRILIIIDEVHHVVSKNIAKRNEERLFSSLFKQIRSLSNKDNNKLICASATPVINNSDEFYHLINLLRSDVLDQKDIKITNDAIVNIKNIRETLYGICSYNIRTQNNILDNSLGYNGMAEKRIFIRKLTMSPEQSNLYDMAEKYDNTSNSLKYLRVMRKLISSFAFNKLKTKKNMTNDEFQSKIKLDIIDFRKITQSIKFSSKFIQSFINDEDITVYDEYNNYVMLYKYSCKYIDTCKLILKSEGKVLVYESFVNFEGVLAIIEYFKCFNISYIEYSNRTINNRDNLLGMFNSIDNTNGENIKVCVFSSAGNEGISFLSINDVIIANIPWSDSVLKQVIGRAIRYNSHEDLPTERRYVNVHILLSYTTSNKSIDNEILEIIKKKSILVNLFNTLFKSVSIEHINKLYPYANPIEGEYIFNHLRRTKIKNVDEISYVKNTQLVPIYYVLSDEFSNIYRGYLDKTTNIIYYNKAQVAKISKNTKLIIHNNDLVYVAEPIL